MEYWEEEIEEEEEEEEEGCNQMSGLHHSCRLLDFDTKSASAVQTHISLSPQWPSSGLPVCPLGVQNPLKSILCILTKGNLPSNVTGKANFYSRAL